MGIPDLRRWIFEHDVIELCTAAKGAMLCRLLEAGARKVVYLDPDLALFDSLREIEVLLDHHNVILTPHQIEPDDERPAILDNEIGSLKWGIYNLGFLGVADTAEGRRFARWWRDRLLRSALTMFRTACLPTNAGATMRRPSSPASTFCVTPATTSRAGI